MIDPAIIQRYSNSVAATPDNDSFLPTRQSLLSRLREWDDEKSWREFVDTYGKLVFNVARRAGLRREESEDVVQDTLLAVAKQMPGFQYDRSRGSFKSWLQTIAWRRIHDQRRKDYHDPLGKADTPAQDGTAPVELVPEPGGLEVWDDEWRRHLLSRAIVRLGGKVSARQRQLFELSVVQGWSPAKVCTALGIGLAAFYVGRHRVGRLVKKEILALRAELGD
jgi:RNA polymerase sigma factor (sigma-70 family)